MTHITILVLIMSSSYYTHAMTSSASTLPTPQCQVPSQAINPLSRIDQITCSQYATAQLTPDQSKFIQPSAQSKNNVAFGVHMSANRAQISTTLKNNAYINHPAGASLFPSNGSLASSFDSLIATIKNAGAVKKDSSVNFSYFVPIFRKVQFMVLNDLYNYLISIYTAFSLTHQDTLSSYETLEPATALNKKTLIVNHLLNVIQAQMFFICAHHQPLIPKHMGLKAGSIMLTHDSTIDPLFLLQNFDQPFFSGDLKTNDQKAVHATLKSAQQTYLSALKEVINFFSTFTAYLSQQDTTSKVPGSNAFYPLASQVAKTLAQDPFTQKIQAVIAMPSDIPSTGVASSSFNSISSSLKSQGLSLKNASTSLPNTAKKINALRNLKSKIKPLNPPIFCYDTETLRAIRIIPLAAQELPVGVKSLSWPTQLVTAATKQSPAVDAQNNALGYLVAYFTDAQGNIVKGEKNASKLFLNLPTSNGPYAQEIKKQPIWLNSKSGVIEILSGCLGDYSKLLGKDILQPCTENIICAALGTTCAQKSTTSGCQTQMNQISQIRQEYVTQLAKQTTSTSPSSTPSTPPSSTTTPATGSTTTGSSTSSDSGTSGSSSSSEGYPSALSGYLTGGGGTTTGNQ